MVANFRIVHEECSTTIGGKMGSNIYNKVNFLHYPANHFAPFWVNWVLIVCMTSLLFTRTWSAISRLIVSQVDLAVIGYVYGGAEERYVQS